jgi:hypothetical protein
MSRQGPNQGSAHRSSSPKRKVTFTDSELVPSQEAVGETTAGEVHKTSTNHEKLDGELASASAALKKTTPASLSEGRLGILGTR